MRDPPKPRLSTGSPGKSVARDSQYRIDELPTKSTGDGGGGDALSSRTKALSSAAKRALSGSGVGATTAAGRARRGSAGDRGEYDREAERRRACAHSSPRQEMAEM